MLGIKSFLGAIPNDDLSEQRGSQGVLISYEFWKRHFGGDPKMLGQTVFVTQGRDPLWPFWNPVLTCSAPGSDVRNSWDVGCRRFGY